VASFIAFHRARPAIDSDLTRRRRLRTLLSRLAGAAGIGGNRGAWRCGGVADCGAGAQPSRSTIGLLGGALPEDNDPLLLAFVRGPAEAGYVEGKNLEMEYRWARGQYNLLGEMAAATTLIKNDSPPSARPAIFCPCRTHQKRACQCP
jgi:hypothetical protein